jgi:hypothetical protein
MEDVPTRPRRVHAKTSATGSVLDVPLQSLRVQPERNPRHLPYAETRLQP